MGTTESIEVQEQEVLDKMQRLSIHTRKCTGIRRKIICKRTAKIRKMIQLLVPEIKSIVETGERKASPSEDVSRKQSNEFRDTRYRELME
jgi:hypothetical protein